MLKLQGKHILFSLIVIAAIYIPKIVCPINEQDGAWYFSQASSILQGGGVFNFFTNTNYPVLYGWLQLPLATSYTPIYGHLLFYLTVLLALAFYLIFIFRNTSLVLVVPLLLISNKSILLQRPEIFGILITLILYLSWAKNKKNNTLWLVLGSISISAIHLPMGILCTAAILYYHRLLFRFEIKYYLLAILGIIVLLLACFFYPDNIYISIFIERVHHLSFSPLLKFTFFSGLTILGLIYTSRKHIDKVLIINLIALLLLCTILGGYYYFAYLFIPLLLLLREHKFTLQPNFILFAALTFNVLANVVHPIFVQVENTQYAHQANKVATQILELQKELLRTDFVPKLFIENEFAPAAFTQGKNCRMVLYDPARLQIFDTIASGDKIVMVSPTKLDRFLENRRIENPSESFAIDEKIYPAKGKLSLLSLYTERTDSLGLWILTKR